MGKLLVSAMKHKYIPPAFLPALTIVIDQWTKMLVINRFQLGESISVVSNFFSLTYVQNTGAAFGILAQSHPTFRVPFFIFVPVIALIVISYLFRKLADNDWKMSAALSLVIGGAIGNLIDRIRVGYVIDFLDFHYRYQYHFPAFNVADTAICIGVAFLVFDVLGEEHVSNPA